MKNNNKNIHFFAIAALAATLMIGQVQVSPVFAENKSVQLSSLIPDNVTIEEPVPLSDISLPDSEYGTLSWADDSAVPSERVQSYDVVFHPYDSAILLEISGWDGESDAIYSSVTVVVNSIESGSEESDEYTEDSEKNYDDSEAENDADKDNYDEKQNSSEIKEDQDTDSGEKKDDAEESAEITEKPSEEADKKAENEESDTEKDKKSDEKDNAENAKEDSKTDSEITETPSATETPEVTENPETTEIPEATETPEVTEMPDTTVVPEVTAAPATDENNIFDGNDKDIKKDDRSTVYEEDLTEEQQAELSEENHSCNGITVSGIDLPYYVQFRVASGDDYEFTNESEANVFQSYEFELWDLKNDTEYEVPDGEYVSVTVPVKAGYSYTIEHLLDSGATETIVPSVDGSTMVFSTHSFSPFGIAGSKTLVGEEIEEDGYDTGVVTETPDSVQSADLTPVADSGTATNTNTNTSTNTADSATTGTDSTTTDNSNLTASQENTTAQTASSSNETQNNGQDGSSSSVKAVHTNDPTRILPFVILAAAAAAIVGVIVYLRKRKK